MNSDAPIAAPSAAAVADAEPLSAVDQALQSGDQAAYRDARRAELAGKPLEPAKTTSAASSPAVPAKPATDAQVPAPSAGTPDGKNERRTDPRATENRVPELLAERAQLRSELEGLRRQLAERSAPQTPKPAASSPASAQPGSEDDPEPKLEDFEADPDKYPDPYTAHQRALARWEARREYRALEADRTKAQQHAAEEQGKAARATKFHQELDKQEGGAVAFLRSLHEDVQALVPVDALPDGARPTVLNGVAQRVLESPAGVALMRHFSDHPEELRRIGALPMAWAMVELGKLEGRLESAAAPAAPAAPAKTVTSAPAPGTILGTRPSTPVDEADAAVESGDQAAYKVARMRQLAATRR